MNSAITLLQAAGSGFDIKQLGLFAVIMVVFYFFMIRPQMKKQKELKKFRSALEKGSKVITLGGIHGVILEMNDETVLLSVDSGKVRVEKSAIVPNAAGVLQQGK